MKNFIDFYIYKYYDCYNCCYFSGNDGEFVLLDSFYYFCCWVFWMKNGSIEKGFFWVFIFIVFL